MKLTPGQLRAKAAVYLRTEGHSLGEIGAALGVSKTQVKRMCEQPTDERSVLRALEEWIEEQMARDARQS